MPPLKRMCSSVPVGALPMSASVTTPSKQYSSASVQKQMSTTQRSSSSRPQPLPSSSSSNQPEFYDFGNQVTMIQINTKSYLRGKMSTDAYLEIIKWFGGGEKKLYQVAIDDLVAAEEYGEALFLAKKFKMNKKCKHIVCNTTGTAHNSNE